MRRENVSDPIKSRTRDLRLVAQCVDYMLGRKRVNFRVLCFISYVVLLKKYAHVNYVVNL